MKHSISFSETVKKVNLPVNVSIEDGNILLDSLDEHGIEVSVLLRPSKQISKRYVGRSGRKGHQLELFETRCSTDSSRR